MDKEQAVIRSILAPLARGEIVVPSSVVAEVIEYTNPTPYEHGPGWLLGELEWNGWQVPIISFAMLAGTAERDPSSASSRILVIKTLTEEVSLYYVGILIRGLPKMKKLSETDIEPIDGETASPVVFCRAKVDGREVMLPELNALTLSISNAMYDH